MCGEFFYVFIQLTWHCLLKTLFFHLCITIVTYVINQIIYICESVSEFSFNPLVYLCLNHTALITIVVEYA